MSSAEKTVMFALPNLVSGQLACVAGTAAGRSWDLSAGTFTIGRLDEHDMCLATEPGISKTHAKIIGQGDRYLIVDCESRNGTLLNGELIQKADLYDGDEIRICGCVLRFTQKGGPARPRRVSASAPDNAPTAAFVQPSASMAPMPAAPSMPPMAMPVVVQAPPTGRVLVSYYMGGLEGSLLLGGAASAALIAQAPPPADPIAAPVVETVDAAAVAAATDDDAKVDDAKADVVKVEDGAAVAVEGADAKGDDSADAVDDEDDAVEDVAAASAAATSKPRRRVSNQNVSGPFAASVDPGKSEVLRSKTGGRVKTALSEGATVQKGTVIVTFESGADAAEIATLQDRIASLEAVESDEAKRDLKAAKAKLAALEGGQNAAPVVATVDGTLKGMTASVGSVVKAGESIAKVVDADVAARVRVTVARGTRARSGQKVMMNLKSGGSLSGTVVAVSGRTVIVDPGSEAAENVDSVKF